MISREQNCPANANYDVQWGIIYNKAGGMVSSRNVAESIMSLRYIHLNDLLGRCRYVLVGGQLLWRRVSIARELGKLNYIIIPSF